MTGKGNSHTENSNLSFKITLEVSRGSGGYHRGQNGPGPFPAGHVIFCEPAPEPVPFVKNFYLFIRFLLLYVPALYIANTLLQH